MTKFYTYAYLRKDGTPYYIGKGTGNRCFKSQGKPCGVPSDKSRIIILKRDLTEEEAFKHEVYMISVLGRKDNGTGVLRNKTDGGEGASGRECSTVTRLRISTSRRGKGKKGRVCSPPTRLKLSKIMKGKKRSEETRRKIKESKSYISPETRKKISDSLTGRKLPEEVKEKIRKNNANRGRIVSEEERKNISEKLMGRPRPPEVKQKLREATKGRKHWINAKGERKHQRESPGPEWQNGRKWRNPDVF